MRRLRFSICAAIMATLLFMTAQAYAERAYTELYADALKAMRSTYKRQYIALMDMAGDRVPELAHIGVKSSGEASLHVYYLDGETLREKTSAGSVFSFDTFSFKGLKQYTMEFRANGTTPCLSVILRSISGGVKLENRVAFTAQGERALEPVHQQSSTTRGSRVTSRINMGTAVSASAYKTARARFQKTYPKKGASLKVYAIAATESANSITNKVNALDRRYQKAATLTGLKLNRTRASVMIGATVKVSVTRVPTTAIYDEIALESANGELATVTDAGVITGVQTGKVNIRAKAGAVTSKSCAVTVTAPKPTAVKLNKTSATLVVGGNFALQATVQPATAATVLTYSTGNAEIVSVSDEGVMTAKKAGSTTVSVRTSNGKTAKCKIKVVRATTGVVVDISQHNYSSKMDWAKIAKSVDLLILRCGVTRTETAPLGIGTDAQFAFYAKKCQAYGIPFGVYYYGKVATAAEAEKEAEMAYKTASAYKPLFYVYDCEERMLNKEVIGAFIKRIKELGAAKTGLYVAHHLYATYKVDSSIADFLWIPHYGTNDGSVNSSPSYACDMHQYTSMGRIDGFPGRVDVNRLTGTRSLDWFLN